MIKKPSFGGHVKRISLCAFLMMSGVQGAFANTSTAIQKDPFDMVKEINHLYLSVVMDEVSFQKKKVIMCTELPHKIQQYLKIPQTDKIVKSYMSQALSSVKSNIELTKNTLRISC